MHFYTDVGIRGNNILLRGYDNGHRVQEKIPYKPSLFIPTTDKTKFTNIHGKPLDEMQFDSIYDAKDFLKKYKDVHGFNIYGMNRFVYPYISETFDNIINYDQSKIKILYLDIEVDTEDGFPDIDLANKHITAITFREGNIRTVLGLKKFDKKKLTRITDIDNIFYYQFENEEDLLRSFIQLWKAADPDIISGWNCELFDCPYIVKRIIQVLGEDMAKSLSPWGLLKEQTINNRGKDLLVYYPVGIAILDYMVLYKKFTYTQRESYSLNYISHIELGVKKIDYEEYGSLAELYKKDHQLFIEYNIIDVDLIHQLEDKLRLIELVFAIAYDAKVNYADALGSVLLWDVLIMNYLRDRNIIINPQTNKTARNFEGAYVKDPIVGLHKWVVSFDITSLYPHIIKQYNISPETFIKKVSMNNIDTLLETKTFPFYDNASLAANGCLYSNETYGFLPALMSLQFDKRSEYKKNMFEAEKELSKAKNDPTKRAAIEKEISRWKNAQMAKKIQLNSAYGAFANEYFRWYEPNHAEAITLSGQLIIRWIANAVNSYLQKVLKNDEKDYIIAVDTDSIYINMEDLIISINPPSPIDFLDLVSKTKIEPYINKKFDELAKITNAYKNEMHMKREAIADKVIWRAKKNYIANVWDNEGIRYDKPKLKMMGIETIRSSIPAVCRKKIEETIKIILDTDEQAVQEFIKSFKNEFKKLPIEDISFPRSVKNISKYSTTDGYALGSPVHVKGSIIYNRLIKKHKMSKKNSIIYDNDKIKFCYLKVPNILHEEVIAFPNILPKELGIDEYIDYDTMFYKSYLKPVESLLHIIGWKSKKVSSLESFFG